MKTYSFSKVDLEYLTTLDNTMNAMNVAIQVYVVNNVYKRLSLSANSKARYDLAKGELYVAEEADLNPPKGSGTPEPHIDAEKKPAEVPAEPVKN